MAGGKQNGAAGKKANAKPTATRKASKPPRKNQPQDDNLEYSELREAIDGRFCVFMKCSQSQGTTGAFKFDEVFEMCVCFGDLSSFLFLPKLTTKRK